MTKPLTIGVFGAKGCGKTAWALQYLRAAKPARLAVWDFKHDPRLASTGRAYSDLPAFFEALKARRFQARYLVDHDADIERQFDGFCRALWLAGDAFLYVCELPELVKHGRQPASWRKVVNIGREYRRWDGQVVGLWLLADGQRPAECGRSFIANLDVLHCGRLGDEDDARTAAKKLGVPWPQLMQLPDLHWLERAPGDTAPRSGVLRLPGVRAKKTTPPPETP